MVKYLNVPELVPVNGGAIVDIEGMKVEILSHCFHNPHCDIVCCYFFDEQGNKVELTYYKYNDDSKNADGSIREGHEVYKFKKASDLQHYWSRNYKVDELPTKYLNWASKLVKAHRSIDFNQYTERR